MSNIQFKFGDFCMVCLRESTDLIYLKSEDQDSITYIEKLQIANNGLIPDMDIYPNWICSKCKNHLCFCYKFYKKCEKAFKILNECLNQIKTANFGNNSTKFYITNIQNLQSSYLNEEDPLIIKDDDLKSSENDANINDKLTLNIKQESELDHNFSNLEQNKSDKPNLKIVKIDDLISQSANIEEKKLLATNLELNKEESLLVKLNNSNKKRLPKNYKNLDQIKKRERIKSKNLESNNKTSDLQKILSQKNAPGNFEILERLLLDPSTPTTSKNLDIPTLEPNTEEKFVKKYKNKRQLNKSKKFNLKQSTSSNSSPKKLDPSLVKKFSESKPNKIPKKMFSSDAETKQDLILEPLVDDIVEKKIKLEPESLDFNTDSNYYEDFVTTPKNDNIKQEIIPPEKDPLDFDDAQKNIYENNLSPQNGPRKIQIDTRKLLYTCKICFKSFKLEQSLKTHAQVHEDKFYCAACGLSFRFKHFLAEHLETHEKFLEQCKICKKSFQTKKNLQEHYNKHARNDKLKILPAKRSFENDKFIDCNICNLRFKERKALILHMRTHFD